MKSHFRQGFLKGIILPVLLFAVLVGFLLLAVKDADTNSDIKQQEFILQALHKAAVSCYAIEGRYPANVKYMEDRYGVVIDHDKYLVDYDIFASNIMPVIRVYFR